MSSPSPFRYTPYAGRKTPFSIGLEPLDPDAWLEPDRNLGRYLDEKQHLFATRYDDVFRARPDTEDAQSEVLDMLASYLPARHDDIYSIETDGMRIAGPGRVVSLTDPDRPPLERAARLVQDDLVLMRKGPKGYELAAAAVCFPSSWTLAEKFDRPLDAIHAPVPGYEGKMARRLNLIFDRLPDEQIVWRTNWSVYDSDRLPAFRSGSEFAQFRDTTDFDRAFLRVERQTLRRLPISGDLLFTIMIYVDPLNRLRNHPDRQLLAKGLRQQVLALDADQLGYKSLTRRRDQLAGYLETIIDDG
ncbi:MAG: DUF3445 domain-containing protein [Pseudomonadota bacterium]